MVPRVYLTDTLESPHAEPPQLPLFNASHSGTARQGTQGQERSASHCLPWAIRRMTDTKPLRRRMGIARDHGSAGATMARARMRSSAIFSTRLSMLDTAFTSRTSTISMSIFGGGHWWKVFEQDTPGGGAVSFITASSYLDGDAFCGMREHMRRQCEEIWILDLGGEGRGTRQSDNVFAIQTPVAIAVAFRSKDANRDTPAQVHYARVEGTRQEKLTTLDAIDSFVKVEWQDCADAWQAPFRPEGKSDYFVWPLLTDLMPWQQSGAKLSRTWPIGSNVETLERRWRGLLASQDRATAFKETRDRKINSKYPALFEDDEMEKPIAELPPDAPVPRIERYAYRSFDRQRIIADSRMGDVLSIRLWRVHGERQVYLTSLLTQFLGRGPALTACALVPDLHHFSGRGAKDAIPLYRTADASEPNILPGLLDLLGAAYKREVRPEDFLAYIYGVLAQPTFTAQFEDELETRELRVPITKDAAAI